MQRQEPTDLERRPRPAARRWTVRDVIDFEHLVHQEGDTTSVADRELFTHAIAPALRPQAGERRLVFLSWVDLLRSRSGPALPGEIYDRGRNLVQAFAMVLGLVVGCGLAGSLLSHSEAEPINALMFFGGTVGLQLVVLLLVGVAWLLRKAKVQIGPLRDATLLLVGLVGRMVSRLNGERRATLRARWAALDFRSEQLAPLVQCQLLVVTQLFAMAFNAGLLAAMLLVYLPFVELRFGWQSTYSLGAGGVDAWVRLVSAPWAWISTVLAPDPGQVAATQYTRGQHAETLPVAAARAWWPFLICAIVFYGLMLRTLLALLARAVLRRRLGRLQFTYPAANALWRRMSGPIVTSEGDDTELPAAQKSAQLRRAVGAGLLVIDNELERHEEGTRTEAERILRWHIGRSVKANVDDDALRSELVVALREQGESVVVATLATRDPIVAIAGFLRALSAKARPGADITLLLVGEARDGGFAPVPEERLAIWKRFVGIHRLGVGVERCT